VRHGELDEALLVGQQDVVGARVRVQGLWSPAHRDDHRVAAALPLQQVARARFVRRNQTCESTGKHDVM